MSEEWKAVLGWAGLYEVSNFGRVRSLLRRGENGKQAQRLYGGKLLTPIKKRSLGYLCVTLRKTQIKVQALVHRMVLEAFVGSCPDGFQGCHNNGIRDDNRLENLRWDSVVGNQKDKAKHGTLPLGERVWNARLTADEVLAIRASTEKQQVLADRYGVTQVCISRIKLRKVWAHL